MDSNKTHLTGLKKRQQIANANKMIFIWVIIASVAVSLCGVTIQFLVKQAIFNQQVIGAKLETQSTLGKNLENVDGLKKNVDALLANTDLAKVKANPEDTTLKVVLDALPTQNDRSAFGASLQQVILPKSGVSTNNLSTISDSFNSDETAGVATGTIPTTRFDFTATGNYDQTKEMLLDIERSIRPINVTGITFQSSEGAIRSQVTGNSYYLPEQTVQLGKKTIKP